MPKSPTMLLAEVNAIVAGGEGIVDSENIRVGLYTTAPSVAKPDLVADFGLPSAGNYLALPPTTVTVGTLRLDGRRTITLSGMRWDGDADQLPVTFLGFYVKAAAADTHIMFWRAFDQPVVLVSAENAVELVVRYSVSDDPDDIEVVVING